MISGYQYISFVNDNLGTAENMVINDFLPDGTFPEDPAVVVRSDVFLAQMEHGRLETLSTRLGGSC